MELALRGHNLGGLVIPESAVITEKASDEEAQRVRRSPRPPRREGERVQHWRGEYPDGRRPRFDVPPDAVGARWFGVDVVVSGAGQPADGNERPS